MFFWDKTPCNVVDINGMIFGKKRHDFWKKVLDNKNVFSFHFIYKPSETKFYIFLTVHLRIILVGDQLDAQFLL